MKLKNFRKKRFSFNLASIISAYKFELKYFKDLFSDKVSTRRKILVLLTYSASLGLFAILGGVFLVVLIFVVFSTQLPDPNRLIERRIELSTKITDRNGQSIYEVYRDKNRTFVTLDDVSPNIIHATLAAEDSDFYIHQGYSLRGMLRAAFNTLTGQGLQGGSTLTQQVVKNTLLTQERTITRKIKEAILSLQLENGFSKDEILQMYLNETPYGGQNYGVYTASLAYFNKKPKDLTVAEAAFIAGLPQRPSYYSPYSSNPNAGLERKDYVLYLMNVRGWLDEKGKRHFLSDEDYEKAKAEVLVFGSAKASFKAPHFVFYVRDLLAQIFGEDLVETGGLQVKTTLDLELQEKAEEIVKTEIDAAASLNVGNGALVAINPKNGQILTMVGSKDYFADPAPEGCTSGTTGEGSCVFDPNLNVTLARRQPGSSIKPITYATLLSQGYTAAFPFLDVPTVFSGEGVQTGKTYVPRNYDGKFRGVVSLRKSLANSLNITAVKALKLAGIDAMIDQSESMGISTFKDRSRYGLSLTLGGGETKLLELTNAYAVFSAKGIYRDPVAILEVTDAKGKVLYKWKDNGGKRVLDEGVAFLISDILSDDGARSDAFGFGSLLNIPNYQVAVKTGTTDDKKDNYAIGYTPSIAVGVWVGNNNNEVMNPILSSGVTGATPIWNKFMKEFLKGKQNEKFDPPKNVKKIEVDQLTGMLPYGDNAKRPEWFIEGTEPTARSFWYQRLEICKDDGKLANNACKDANRTDQKTFIKITAELPEWQSFVDSWVQENYKEEKYFPPQIKSVLKYDGDDPIKDVDPAVEFIGFKDGDIISPIFRLSVEVSSPNDIERVSIYLNGEKQTDDKSYPYGYNFDLSEYGSGSYEFKAVAVDDDGRSGGKTIKLNLVSN